MQPNNISSIEAIFANPQLLLKDAQEAWKPSFIEPLVRGNPAWDIGPLLFGSQKDNPEGRVIREKLPNSFFSSRMLQYHPGGGHHGSPPYWKVSSPLGGTVRIGPQFSATQP